MIDTSALEPVTVEVISDVVCPWCFLGSRRLDRALKLIADVRVDLTWRPYQLDPTLPPGGLDRRAYLERKFGSAEKVAAAHERIAELGRAEGIAFDFARIARAPNTLDAHRVIRWAGIEGVQSEVVERLFAAYFEQGEDVGDRAVLARVAASGGLDEAIVARLLASDADRAETLAEAEAARAMGVGGVPTFVIDRALVVEGAQPADVLAGAILEAATERAAAPG